MSNTLPQNMAVFDINEKYQLKSQHQITVGKKVVIFLSYFHFYMVVGVLTQSKCSALGNKYMLPFFFLLLWVTLWHTDLSNLGQGPFSGRQNHVVLSTLYVLIK